MAPADKVKIDGPNWIQLQYRTFFDLKNYIILVEFLNFFETILLIANAMTCVSLSNQTIYIMLSIYNLLVNFYPYDFTKKILTYDLIIYNLVKMSSVLKKIQHSNLIVLPCIVNWLMYLKGHVFIVFKFYIIKIYKISQGSTSCFW